MNSAKFRKELQKIMPGYKWTVHRQTFPSSNYISATGIQIAGYNRTSTLQVTRRIQDDQIEYEAKSAGYGLQAPWLSEYTDGTLARALRGLQEHYENKASTYSGHAGSLEFARKKHNPPKKAV